MMNPSSIVKVLSAFADGQDRSRRDQVLRGQFYPFYRVLFDRRFEREQGKGR
jgi:hypothetical protein